jgi:hypothetical protein
MIGTPVLATEILLTLTAAAQLSPSGVRQAGELTRLFNALANQAIALAGGGALLGLGLGVLIASVGVYLYKQRQIQAKLQS